MQEDGSTGFAAKKGTALAPNLVSSAFTALSNDPDMPVVQVLSALRTASHRVGG